MKVKRIIRDNGTHPTVKLRKLFNGPDFEITIELTETELKAACKEYKTLIEITTNPNHINALDLPQRPYNCLIHNGIDSITELIKLTPHDLYNIQNMGLNSIQEIINACNKHGTPIKDSNIPITSKHIKRTKSKYVTDERALQLYNSFSKTKAPADQTEKACELIQKVVLSFDRHEQHIIWMRLIENYSTKDLVENIYEDSTENEIDGVIAEFERRIHKSIKAQAPITHQKEN